MSTVATETVTVNGVGGPWGLNWGPLGHLTRTRHTSPNSRSRSYAPN